MKDRSKNKRNHDRAKRIVDSWPDWKKEVTLTKYSEKAKKK